MEPWHPVLETPDDWAAHPAWRWPWWKLGLQPNDLFTSLHEQYNTYRAPLQDFEAFHHDISEAAAAAADTADFHRRMAIRQKERLTEMIAALDHVALRVTASPGVFDGASSASTWADSVAFFRHRSLDAIVRFFGGLVAREDGEAALPAVTETESKPTVQEPLTPPPLDDEADLSLVSTVEDSMTSDSDSSVIDQHTLRPEIVGNDSPLRASPRLRQFVLPELAPGETCYAVFVEVSRDEDERRKSDSTDEAEEQWDEYAAQETADYLMRFEIAKDEHYTLTDSRRGKRAPSM
ncbi:uncharacterized protein B0I36DRAFT_366886 [Microdochium trichocladiopsis]|uniref:Uncharacterized protein n=1 Tax=Microdochium trichocladiopsis TaxID=1682393 RepID=A0A9P8Y0H4_9PEZI|nr:uncharacterized protein B0I36DRAFT_366886 [Microdochium trichocladiopsis]KAH7024988.1 hypothetical protein B0I36DRAFT_366886 [Microdochium trichocladiopsis]